jgi:hypothetical protein
MRINFDRLSKLAGLPANGNNNRRGLYEGKDMGDLEGQDEGRYDEMEDLPEMAFDPEELSEESDPEAMDMDDGADMEDMDEMADVIEVDEAMLVQELRRAKRIMQENKRRRLSESRRRSEFDRQLKQVIDEEVQNVMDEMNLNSQWVYGKQRPTRSRKGYTHQGSFLPGLGFKR